MTETIKDCPAFPAAEYMVAGEVDQETVIRLRHTQGMTLRDYFAARAMMSIADHWYRNERLEIIAKTSYEIADAMLAERNK